MAIEKKTWPDRIDRCKELAKMLEEIGVKVGEEALEFTMYAGRKTVRGRDVKIAAKKVLNPSLR